MSGGDEQPAGVTRVFLCGVGGLGTLMTADVLARAAAAEKLPVVTAEVHGASQRGGSVQTSVVIGGARSPLIPTEGADFVVALEPLEALRYRDKIGSETVVVSNTDRVVPVTVTMGGPEYPSLERIAEKLGDRARRLIWFNATDLAREVGLEKAANAALLGALASSETCPISEEALRERLLAGVPDRYRKVNREAFEAGWSEAAADQAV